MYLFDIILKKFLNDKYTTSTLISTAKKDVRYIKLPYLGQFSIDVKKQLRNILRHRFPQIDFRIIFTNTFTVGSILKKPMKISADLTSCCVYSFTCPCCNARYVGSSTRWLQHRVCEHRGVSFRTNFPLSNPPFSAIREHSEQAGHTFTRGDFEIVNSCSNRADLLILEALYIERMKPSLNRQSTFQLYTK